MKSERRHELETNYLAGWLAKVITAVKPYQNAILGVVLLVVVAAVVYTWWSRESAGRAAQGWDGFYQALAAENPRPDDFEDIAKANPGTPVAHWAATMAGDLYLASGCDELFVNKAVASDRLGKAIRLYSEVLEQSRGDMLRERATFGLARALEAQGTTLDKAIQHYKEVTTNWPNGAFKEAAARRLADLERPATKAMYDKFAKFTPKPPAEPGSGERLPFDLNTLPEGGPLFEPKMMDLQEKGAKDVKPQGEGSQEKPAAPAPSQPEQGTPAGASPTPGAPAPAAETPAQSATPAAAPTTSPPAAESSPTATPAPDAAAPQTPSAPAAPPAAK